MFARALDVELEKITSFYQIKEQELVDDVNALLRDIGDSESEGYDGPGGNRTAQPSERSFSTLVNARRASTMSRGSTEGGDEDDSDEEEERLGETAALTRKRRSSVGTSRRGGRQSTTYDDYAEQAALYSSDIMLKRRIVALYVQLCELKSYVQLNKTGFRKVLKKFDKICDRQLRQKYMESTVEPAQPFRPESASLIEGHVASMERAYADLATQGDLAVARRDLRSHLREHVVWERNTVWRDMIGMERRAEAASLGRALLGRDASTGVARLQGDEEAAIPTKEIVTPLGRFRYPAWLFSTTMLNLVVISAVFVALLVIPIMKSPEQQNCLAMLVFASLMWATEVCGKH